MRFRRIQFWIHELWNLSLHFVPGVDGWADIFYQKCSRHKITIFRRWMLISGRLKHDDVIKWKHFLRYWPFVRGIHRSPVNSPHKGQWRGAFMFSLICLNKRLSKQSWGWWFETTLRQLWCHSNDNNITDICIGCIIWSTANGQSGIWHVPVTHNIDEKSPLPWWS